CASATPTEWRSSFSERNRTGTEMFPEKVRGGWAGDGFSLRDLPLEDGHCNIKLAVKRLTRPPGQGRARSPQTKEIRSRVCRIAQAWRNLPVGMATKRKRMAVPLATPNA